MDKNEFRFLDDDSKELLEADPSSRMGYIDLLSYLHDLLANLGNHPQRPRFPVDRLYREIADLVHLFPSESQIGEAARSNVAVAEYLHSALGRNFSEAAAKKSSGLREVTDGFLADLVQEYNLIRNIRAAEGARR